MFPQLRLTASSAFALLLASCANVAVTTDYDRAVDFSKYRTYAWVREASADQRPAQSIPQAVQHAVDAGLAAKGCTLSGSPAFLVRARFAAKEQIAMHRHTDWGGAGAWPQSRQGGGGNLWPVTPHTLTDVDRFTEAMISLEFLDSETRRLLWRGEGEIVFGTAAENARSVEEAVAQLLKRFPPKRRRAN
jgi:hypothetical protein